MSTQVSSIKLDFKEICKDVKQCHSSHYIYFLNSYFNLLISLSMKMG